VASLGHMSVGVLLRELFPGFVAGVDVITSVALA